MCESIPATSTPSRANPRAFEKIVQIPGPAGSFSWQMPALPRSYYDGQMASPPVHPTNIQNY